MHLLFPNTICTLRPLWIISQRVCNRQVCSMHDDEQRTILVGNLKGRGHLRDRGADERIILKRISK